MWGFSACSDASTPTAGPGLLLDLAEGGSYAAIGLGLAVLALQVLQGLGSADLGGWCAA